VNKLETILSRKFLLSLPTPAPCWARSWCWATISDLGGKRRHAQDHRLASVPAVKTAIPKFARTNLSSIAIAGLEKSR
jgi:hypothetical protein